MPPIKKPRKSKTGKQGKSGKSRSNHWILAISLVLLGSLLLSLILLPKVWQKPRPLPPQRTAPVAVPPPPPVKEPAASPLQKGRETRGGGRLAIIMDDLGRDIGTAEALLAIDLPVTFAILPGEAYASRVASLAHRSGREVIIHIPMEPQGYPSTDPGEDALLVAQSPEEIRRRFQGFIEGVPHAVGGNNHMGSRFTEYGEGMEVVLAEMKAAGLFFVDSRTSPRSVGMAEAVLAGVPATSRDLFLDNEQDVELISREIRKLAALAGRQGEAVGICHPYPETLEALRREAAYLRQQSIELVPVSRLLPR